MQCVVFTESAKDYEPSNQVTLDHFWSGQHCGGGRGSLLQVNLFMPGAMP